MSQVILTAGQAFAANAAATAATVATAYATNQAITASQNALFGPLRSSREGPQLDELRLMGAQEGAPIPRLYGRSRLAGQIVWATPFQETTRVTETRAGGKGVTRTSAQEVTEYLYSVSLAVALCEGEIDRVGRVWADGQPLALRDIDHRIHRGGEDQLPDPLIEAALGEEAPAYRGLAYIVFENLGLERFGNRIPQLTFEVERSLRSEDPDSLENAARAVTLIPASGEAAYGTSEVLEELDEGVTRPANVHNNQGGTDYTASIDHLQDALPNTGAVSLIVSWFGTDLRAGQCRIVPGVEAREKTLLPDAWSVAGQTRADAYVVSERDGGPAYGGTPADKGVIEAIRDLNERGLAVTFYPFILMDIAPGNGLLDPYGAAEQGAYPWRGRITAAAGTDGTADARVQVDAFFDGYEVMVRHYAELSAEAGGVDAFLIASELRGLTRVRDEAGRYPGAERLVGLARLVKTILPDAKVSYAADWSEYAHHQPGDGSLLYPLDQLWADESCDFIGIDDYMPMSDWRGAGAHLDAEDWSSEYDIDYLQSNIRGGEGYDWFYASRADRDAQIRTPITDGAHGEPWVYRYKDLWSWWSEPHHERPGGVRAASPTAWVPRSKPFWLTEMGGPAVHLGTNQPNVFVDPKSSESALPYHSSGERDDLIQRRLIEAKLSFWADPDNNPSSPLYAGAMVEPARIFLYTWDARPFPEFPVRAEVWSDAENWTFGHWLNGRAGRVPLGALIEDIARRAGLHAVDASACTAMVTGYVLDRPLSGRAAIQPLMDLYQLDATERGGLLVVSPRTGVPNIVIGEDDLVDLGPDDALIGFAHAQASELPVRLSITYTDGLSDYRTGVAEAVVPGTPSQDAGVLRTAIVLEQGEAEGRALTLLAEAQGSGATASFSLPPGRIAIEPSDVVSLPGGQAVRLTAVTDGPYREAQGTLCHPGLYEARYTGLSGTPGALTITPGPVLAEVMDLPILPTGQDGLFVRVAAFAEPWPGAVSVLAGQGAEAPLALTVRQPVLMGRLTADLAAGPVGRWDRASVLRVRLPAGGLASLTEAAVFAGGGRAAIRTGEAWEVIQYRDAVLTEAGDWRLTTLLRGQRGTEAEALRGAEAGARIVFLAGTEAHTYDADALGREATWQAGPANRTPGRFPYRDLAVAANGASARPFAPAHLRADPSGADITLSWIRRSRIGGDALEGMVPLGEAEERYEVRGFEGGSETARFEVTGPTASVPATTQTVEVRQVSALVGPGRAAALALSP